MRSRACRAASAELPGGAAGRPRPSPHGGLHDAARFAGEWLRNPVATAAIAPSGRALAALIVREVDAATGPVLELGPGTGVFTRALAERGVAEADLTLVERNPAFAVLLRRRYPRAAVLTGDAADLSVATRDFGAVVCGLGLRNMSAEQVEAIVRAAFARLRPGGAFYLFTYGRRCSVPRPVLDRLALKAEHVGTAFRNLPPARVYRLTTRLQD